MSGHGQRQQMTRNQQWGLGIAAFCVLSVGVYGIGQLTGYKGGDQPTPAQAVSAPTFTVASPKPGATAAGVGSVTVTVAPKPKLKPAVAIDQAGDPGTPCAMTYRAEGPETVVRFTFQTSGEIVTHLGDKSGDLFRHDDQVQAGSRAYVDPVALSQVDDAGAIFQDPDGTRHVCSIAPQG